MSRRRLLRAGGITGLVALSGCTEDIGEEFPPNTRWPTAEVTPSLPVEEKSDVLEHRIETLANESITTTDEFAEAVDDYALEVESVEREQEVLTIEYINANLYDEGNLHDIAPIAGAFAALLESGYEAVALGITILDAAPESYGAASIEGYWAEAYNDGELSAAEYGELVMTTVESHRHQPDVEVTPRE